MSTPTKFLSKLVGLYCILMSLTMFTRKPAMLETMTVLIHDNAMLFLVGVILAAAGLAMILTHNVWSGGALPVIVTLIGWGTLLKGVVFLVLTPDSAASFYLGDLHYEQMFYTYASVTLLLGVYLTYGGFRKE